MKNVPKNLKRYATNLIDVLKRHRDVITWDKNGELIIKNRRISGSNITDLFYMVFHNTPRNFIGKTAFLNILKELNTPNYLIKNTYLVEEDGSKKKRYPRRRQPSPGKESVNKKQIPVKKPRWETYK